MAVLWRFPGQPQTNNVGTPVTAAALTSGLLGTDMPVIPGGIYAPGARLSIHAHGEVTATSSTPTVILGFYFNPVGSAIASGNVLAVTGSLAFSASATLWPFILKWEGTVRSLATGVSANGVIHGQGICFWWGNVSLTGTPGITPIPQTAAARTVSNFNTQIANQIDCGVTLSSSTGISGVWITDFFAELTG